MGVSIVSNFNDLAGFGAFMVSLWGLLPDIVRGLILAVAALFVIIGVIQLIVKLVRIIIAFVSDAVALLKSFIPFI